MPVIQCSTKILQIDSSLVVLLPKEASKKLPSRGMTMVKGTINRVVFQMPLEPDGRGSHWFRLDKKLLNAIHGKEGSVIDLSLEPVKDWPEPDVPSDLQKALKADPKVNTLWKDITPMARWDWIRWVRSTKNPATRQKHVVVACDKMRKGERRPCCFNRSMCTDPSVSKNGILFSS